MRSRRGFLALLAGLAGLGFYWATEGSREVDPASLHSSHLDTRSPHVASVVVERVIGSPSTVEVTVEAEVRGVDETLDIELWHVPEEYLTDAGEVEFEEDVDGLQQSTEVTLHGRSGPHKVVAGGETVDIVLGYRTEDGLIIPDESGNRPKRANVTCSDSAGRDE